MPIHQQDQVDQDAVVGQATDSSVVLLDDAPIKAKLAAVVLVNDRVVGGGGVGRDQVAEIDVEPRMPHAQGDRVVGHLHLEAFFDDTAAKGPTAAGELGGSAGGSAAMARENRTVGSAAAAVMPCSVRAWRSVRRFTPLPPRDRARGVSCGACCD